MRMMFKKEKTKIESSNRILRTNALRPWSELMFFGITKNCQKLFTRRYEEIKIDIYWLSVHLIKKLSAPEKQGRLGSLVAPRCPWI